ncbi:MAG TPA: diguanylate cyclase [Acidimicrobiales bacterium]|nr:diguanylate cyclase [Acidimicrobiales bacterium]
MSLHESESGLLNEQYFRAALPNRVATARRVLRPISVVLARIGSPQYARQVAYALLDTLRESDTACRLDDGGFALILEDTPENGAVWTIERLRRLLTEQGIEVIVWAGVASYPAHALEAPALVALAEGALVAAQEWQQSRIEVALPE